VLEVTGHKIKTGRMVVHNFPAQVLQPVTSPFGTTGPAECHLCRILRKHLDCTWFAADTDMKQAVTSCLHFDFLYAGMQAFVPQRDKCLNVSGDYMEV